MEFNIIYDNLENILENEIQNENEIELDMYGIPIEQINEEEEEEIRNFIQKLNNTEIINDLPNNKIITKKKNKKQKDNKLLNIKDKDIKDIKDINEISNDICNAQIPTNKLNNIYERIFKPRKIPYLLSDEYKNVKNIKKSSNIVFEFDIDFPVIK